MRQKRFFSSESAHGSESSYGFANDTIVLAFDSKQARDCYVLGRSIGTSRKGAIVDRNLSCKAIRAKQATSEAANLWLTSNDDGRPRPHKSECWIIDKECAAQYMGGDVIREAFSCIGSLEIGSTWDDSVTRFYR